MGKYIEQTSNGLTGSTFEQKMTALVADGATPIAPPDQWCANLVCLVDNGGFAAAAYCYDAKEHSRFIRGRGGRRWQWFHWEKVEEFAS